MSPIFWRNLHLCFPTRLAITKSEPAPEQSSPPLPQPVAAPTKHLFMTNSLYDASSSTSTSTSKSQLMTPSAATTDADVSFFSSRSSNSDAESPPLQHDFAALFASERFFFSSPGRSNSIVESRRDSVELVTPPVDGGVAVKKLSPDPYGDFRSSMVEMIESRNLRDVKSEWEFLHQLLLCYLDLNPTNTHKFIISAFADILVCLLLISPPSTSTNSQHFQEQQG